MKKAYCISTPNINQASWHYYNTNRTILCHVFHPIFYRNKMETYINLNNIQQKWWVAQEECRNVFWNQRREVVMETAGLEIFLLLQFYSANVYSLCYFNKLIFLKSFVILIFFRIRYYVKNFSDVKKRLMAYSCTLKHIKMKIFSLCLLSFSWKTKRKVM